MAKDLCTELVREAMGAMPWLDVVDQMGSDGLTGGIDTVDRLVGLVVHGTSKASTALQLVGA